MPIPCKFSEDEALASGSNITEKMFSRCMNELRHNASLIPPRLALSPPIFVYNGSVVKSGHAVSPELKKELQKAVKMFKSERLALRLRRKGLGLGASFFVSPRLRAYTCIGQWRRRGWKIVFSVVVREKLPPSHQTVTPTRTGPEKQAIRKTGSTIGI